MKLRWLSLCLLPMLAACNSSSDLSASSETVSQQQIDTIIKNIQTQYPKLDHQLQQQILDVAVRAIENMVFVKGGSFMMGDFRAPCNPKDIKRMDWTPEAKCLSSVTSRETGADHLHKVTLDSYSLSKNQTLMLDLDLYYQLIGLPFSQRKTWGGDIDRNSNTYKDRKKSVWKYAAAKTKNWKQSKDYCLWLNKITNLPFDLPTEAQWEFAARSRGKYIYYATNNGYLQNKNGKYFNPSINQYMDYEKNEWNHSALDMDDIGQWPANPIGIYDLANNTREWVNDWYSNTYYQSSPQLNPTGPKTGTEKVYRSGVATKTFDRGHHIPELKKYRFYSFRCSLQQTTPVVSL